MTAANAPVLFLGIVFALLCIVRAYARNRRNFDPYPVKVVAAEMNDYIFLKCPGMRPVSLPMGWRFVEPYGNLICDKVRVKNPEVGLNLVNIDMIGRNHMGIEYTQRFEFHVMFDASKPLLFWESISGNNMHFAPDGIQAFGHSRIYAKGDIKVFDGKKWVLVEPLASPQQK